MNGNEEDLDDFPAENKEKTGRIYGWSTSRRVDRSMDSKKWDHDKDSTTFCGSTFWCKYEDLIDDRLDLTVLEAEKRGPSTEEQTCRRGRNASRTT